MRDIRMQESSFRDSLPNAVARLFRQVARVHNRELKPLGLSAVQAHLLAALWLEGAMTVGELQTVMALQSSTLTGALDRMEKAELIHRVPVPGDRRAVRIEPADWSDERKDQVFASLAATEELCFSGLTTQERKTLLRLLRKSSVNMEDVDASR